MHWQRLSYWLTHFGYFENIHRKPWRFCQKCRTKNKNLKLTSWKAIKCSPSCAIWMALCEFFCFFFYFRSPPGHSRCSKMKNCIRQKRAHHIARYLFQFPLPVEWTQLSREWMAAAAMSSVNERLWILDMAFPIIVFASAIVVEHLSTDRFWLCFIRMIASEEYVITEYWMAARNWALFDLWTHHVRMNYLFIITYWMLWRMRFHRFRDDIFAALRKCIWNLKDRRQRKILL